MKKYEFNSLAYSNLDNFVYGAALKPVSLANGMIIGGGDIYPELNFTLPPMLITKETMPEVLKNYKELIDDACKRAVELYLPAFVAEIETLPPMTFNPDWGIEVCKTVKDVMSGYEAKYGIKTAIRMTPNDIREGKEVKHMWHGEHWENMMKTFEGSAKVGADFLSVESVGGKTIHDDAIMYCDIKKSLFALGIQGCRDMEKLWAAIKDIADKTGTIAAGDTACGFGNTAMVLADKGYVPRIFASVVRVMTAVRSLVAFEQGAQGPHKDCGYEGVFIKAITGTPISMEGKSSACAHLSPVGNIAASLADLWSNESVQNIKLLGGMAPTVSLEQLTYDCRLMNKATEKGPEYTRLLRDLLADSDSSLDPQAYVLRPDVVLELSKEIVKGKTHFERTKLAAYKTIEVLRNAVADKKISVSEREYAWLGTMEAQLDEIPADEDKFIQEIIDEDFDEKVLPKLYDM